MLTLTLVIYQLHMLSFTVIKRYIVRAMVVAQTAERSPLIPGIQGSNPVISNILNCSNLLLTVEKTPIKTKRPGLANLKEE